jgi:outer membrane protein OmpA-like peptidoglycan-associated protein
MCAALVALLASGAAADERANAPTATGETGLFTLFTGDTIPQGEWSFGIYYNNWDRVFEFDDTADLDWHRVSASIGYGVTENWEISLMAPYENLDPDFPGTDDSSESGVGNARLGSKWKVFGDDVSSFAINAFVELPTGDEDVLGGDTGYGAGIAYRKSNWVMNLGYRAPGDVGPDNEVEISDEILAGIGYTSSVSETFDWIWELNGTFPTDSDKALFDDSVDLVGGGRYWFDAEGPWAFNFALRTDVLQLSDTDEHCPIGGLLGFTYFPRLYTVPEPPPPPPPVEYELTVERAGNCAAGGTVMSTPAGIDCGADCSATFVEGTVVSLEAVEAEGCTFDGWTGDSDCADGSVTMNGDRMCVANFSEIPPPPPPPPPKMTEVERTCAFDGGSARVNNACKAILDEVALLMKDNPEAPALVIGYTDSQGSEASNMRMGQRRAESVKNWLVTRHAIDPSRITVESRGEADPVGDNATAAGRKANRRAVIRITVEEDMM